MRYNLAIDVREVLPTIRVPTLVLHRKGDGLSIENGKFLASHIPEANFIEYEDCSDHLIFPGDQIRLCGDIEEFVTGNRDATALKSTAFWRRFSLPTSSISPAGGRNGRSGMASGARRARSGGAANRDAE